MGPSPEGILYLKMRLYVGRTAPYGAMLQNVEQDSAPRIADYFMLLRTLLCFTLYVK